MKKWAGNFLKRLAQLLIAILGLLIVIVSFFSIQANMRETKTRFEAAPSTGRFVQAGDLEIFIQEMGPADGPVILFTHGTGAWSGLWHPAMVHLSAAGYRCIAIDMPPFGFSERPATPSYGNRDQAKRIIALMDSLKIGHVILFGHSFGGGATLETALMIPERVDALILADVGGLNLNIQPAQGDDKPSLLGSFLETPALRNPILAATATNPLLTKKLFSFLILDPADATDEIVGILQQPMVLEDSTDQLGEWLHYVLTTREVSLTSDPANYQMLTVPALVVWGARDTTIPLEEGKYLNSILPNSELVIMEGVNHIPQVEDLDKLTEIVLKFLADLPLTNMRRF